MTVGKCNKYIGHLRKVTPKVIEVNGEATAALVVMLIGSYKISQDIIRSALSISYGRIGTVL